MRVFIFFEFRPTYDRKRTDLPRGPPSFQCFWISYLYIIHSFLINGVLAFFRFYFIGFVLVCFDTENIFLFIHSTIYVCRYLRSYVSLNKYRLKNEWFLLVVEKYFPFFSIHTPVFLFLLLLLSLLLLLLTMVMVVVIAMVVADNGKWWMQAHSVWVFFSLSPLNCVEQMLFAISTHRNVLLVPFTQSLYRVCVYKQYKLNVLLRFFSHFLLILFLLPHLHVFIKLNGWICLER